MDRTSTHMRIGKDILHSLKIHSAVTNTSIRRLADKWLKEKMIELKCFKGKGKK